LAYQQDSLNSPWECLVTLRKRYEILDIYVYKQT
jgi:hypothetical protein